MRSVVYCSEHDVGARKLYDFCDVNERGEVCKRIALFKSEYETDIVNRQR